MRQFTKDHIFILSHADEYRRFIDVSIKQVLDCLNALEKSVGLATDHYTAEKALKPRRLHVYYYLTYPLHTIDTEAFAIVDFIGCTETEDRRARPPKTSP